MVHQDFWQLAGGILACLLLATLIGRLIAWRHGDSPTVRNLNERIHAWWALIGVALPVLALGKALTIALFALLSFMTLREFLSLTPTRPGDRPVLFLAFFVSIPFQYALVAMGWYGLFAVLIPVYGFFLLSAVATLAQDAEHFLESARQTAHTSPSPPAHTETESTQKTPEKAPVGRLGGWG
jgi:phosphatidate cytidylyltransferase